MKLNRKGFVITAILYGLLLLFVMLVSSYLLVLSARKNRLDNIVKGVEGKYNQRIVHVVLTDHTLSDFSNNTIYRLENGSMEDEKGNNMNYEGDFVVNNNGTLKIHNIIPSDDQGWFLCDNTICNPVKCKYQNQSEHINLGVYYPNKDELSYSISDMVDGCPQGSDNIGTLTIYNIKKNMICYINFTTSQNICNQPQQH